MSSTEIVSAGTAKEALDLWDKGQSIAAFEVETERCTQQELYALAFEMIRGATIRDHVPAVPIVEPVTKSPVAAKISKREISVAHSIAYVAVLKGWAVMVRQHLAGGHIKAIAVQKPA